MDVARFMRLFQMRATQVMWLLGAGASRTAGVKTAWDVIWDLKHKLYCSQKKLALSAITDLSDTVVQRKIQEHFDSLGSFPSAGAEDEYSAYFEAAYPSARDRRQYLDGIIEEANPSFGHRALALLMRENLIRSIAVRRCSWVPMRPCSGPRATCPWWPMIVTTSRRARASPSP